MKQIILFFFAFAFLFSPLSTMAQESNSEQISKFVSEITINQDTSLDIKETIDYYTPFDKHGIFRYIPEKYREEGLVKTYPISSIQVTDEFGAKMTHETYREDGNVVIKIGDPNKTFTGSRRYLINYSVDNAIKQQKGFDELYWDITGEGWSFPVLSSKVTVTSPHAGIMETKCFTGRVGGTESDCSVVPGEENTVRITSKSPVTYGENFTVAVKLDPDNSLVFPAGTTSLLEKIKNNLFLGLLPLPALIMFIFWYKKGRDYRFDSPNAFNLDEDQPQRQRPLFEPVNTPMVYQPIRELTPGEAGALIDEKVDSQDVVAEIVELAHKKHLTIERVDKKGFLKFGHDYLLTQKKDDSTGLSAVQKYLMDNIFDTKKEVKLADLKGTFYIHMSKAKNMIAKELHERKIYTTNPDNARVLGIGAALALDIIILVATISSVIFLASAWPIIIYIVSSVTALVFGWNMPQKTAVGTNLFLQAKGLRETIRLGKWREEIKEKHLFIEEVLPFAVSLGVIGKLARDMQTLGVEPPKYVSGGFAADTVAWSGFMSDFSNSAASGLSYNPSSSSSGGSGFSGGSSGGGGGGGGGGSW